MDQRLPRTLIITPWFGSWPGWMGIFLLACKYNPEIHWLIVGDHELPVCAPANVRFEQTSFDEYRERCGAALGASFSWVRPYKLCDLKPAWGIIHRADLIAYELWGWTDLDLLYGDLASCIQQRIQGHSVVSFSGTHLSGEFCLFRNQEAVNNAFRLIHDWKEKMVEDKNHALDEIALSWVFAPPSFDYVAGPLHRRAERGNFVDQDAADRLQQAHPASFENSYTTPSGIGLWHDGSHRHPLVWYWQKGRLCNKTHLQHSYPYLNYLHYKSDYYWRRTLEAYGYSSDSARPLWDDPSGPLNDSLETLEHQGLVVDRRGFSALPMERRGP